MVARNKERGCGRWRREAQLSLALAVPIIRVPLSHGRPRTCLRRAYLTAPHAERAFPFSTSSKAKSYKYMLVIPLLRNHFKSSLLRVPTHSPSVLLARRTFVSRPVMHSPARLTPSHTPGPRSRILVLGAGNFGSCLADHLGDTEHDVFMWSREEDLVKHFNEHQRNLRYLTDHAFSRKIKAIGPELPSATFIKGIDVILFAIPTEGVR